MPFKKLVGISAHYRHEARTDNYRVYASFHDSMSILEKNIKKLGIQQNIKGSQALHISIDDRGMAIPQEESSGSLIISYIPLDLSNKQLIKFFYNSAVNYMLNSPEFEPKDKIKDLLNMPYLYEDLIREIKLYGPNAEVGCYYSCEDLDFVCNFQYKNNHCLVKIRDCGESIYLKLKKMKLEVNSDKIMLLYKNGQEDIVATLSETRSNDKLLDHAFRAVATTNAFMPLKLIIDFKNTEVTWSVNDAWSGTDGSPDNRANPNFTYEFNGSINNLNLMPHNNNQTPSEINKKTTHKAINLHEKEFWRIIDQLINCYDSACTRKYLSRLKPQKLANFHIFMDFYMCLLDGDEFSQHLKLHGDSDDLFSYVRGTVIMSGEEKFKAILAKPELIAEFDGEDTPLIESLEFMAEEVALEELGLSEEQWEGYLEKSKVDVSKL